MGLGAAAMHVTRQRHPATLFETGEQGTIRSQAPKFTMREHREGPETRWSVLGMLVPLHRACFSDGFGSAGMHCQPNAPAVRHWMLHAAVRDLGLSYSNL